MVRPNGSRSPGRWLAGPALVLADEPTGQLDHATADLLVDRAAGRLCDDCGAALVIATHDPVVAGQLPTRWVLRDGRLLDSGPERRPRRGPA